MTETTPNPYKVTETREMTDSEYDDAKNAESAVFKQTDPTVKEIKSILEQLPEDRLGSALRSLGWL